MSVLCWLSGIEASPGDKISKIKDTEGPDPIGRDTVSPVTGLDVMK